MAAIGASVSSLPERESLCPYCGSSMKGEVCPGCSRICLRCGTRSKEPVCPQCGRGSWLMLGFSSTGSPAPAQSPEFSDVQKILGGTPRPEFNMVRGMISWDLERIHSPTENLRGKFPTNLNRRLLNEAVLTLKAEMASSCMNGGSEEPLEFCEECGSPLEDGRCRSCGIRSSEGASPVGAAPLDRKELSRVLGRNVGSRAHGSYALSMQQEEGMAPLRKQIESLVEQFSASPEVKAAAKRSAELLAIKIMDDLGPTRAAIASVAQVFIGQGRHLSEVSSCISRVHPGMDQLRDIIVEVYPEPASEVRVLVNGRERPFRSYSYGLYRRLRIPLFASDGSALVELRNARLTRKGHDAKRVEPLGPSEFQVKADESNFELFKVLEEARLSGKAAGTGADLSVMFRKYSISKLRLTERLLKEAGLLQQVSAEYAALYAQEVENGRGRSPRKLAEEALMAACDYVVPACLSSSITRKYHLKLSEVRSLVVVRELAAWQG